ncbi:MAG: hypothetical protein ABIL09_17495, partial [Gemmatimonadota bacterium]
PMAEPRLCRLCGRPLPARAHRNRKYHPRCRLLAVAAQAAASLAKRRAEAALRAGLCEDALPADDTPRYCARAGCGTRLNRYNPTSLCAAHQGKADG